MREGSGCVFLTKPDLPNSKDVMILEILKLLGAGRYQSQTAKTLGLSRQRVSYWAGVLEELGHIRHVLVGKSTSGRKYYELSDKSKKLLSTSVSESLDAMLESCLHVEHLDFVADILEKDSEGFNRLKDVLKKAGRDGIEHWNRYASTYDDVSFDLHEGINGCDKLVIRAGKTWIGKSSADLVSRAQTACEGYARIIERTFKLRLSPLFLSGMLDNGNESRGAIAIKGDPVIRSLMRGYRKTRTESPVQAHGSPTSVGSWHPSSAPERKGSEMERPKVVVHKGATIATGEYSNVRVDYTVETEVPSGMTASDVITDLETVFNERISKTRETDHYGARTEEAGWEKLPWKKYVHGSGEWIAAETKGAEGLLARLQGSKDVWEGAAHLYKLSESKSSGRLFIQRFPRKSRSVM